MRRLAWFGGLVLLLLGIGAAYLLAPPPSASAPQGSGCPPGQVKKEGSKHHKCVSVTETVTLALTATGPLVTVSEPPTPASTQNVTVDAESQTTASGTGSTVATIPPGATETVTLPAETVTIPASTSTSPATTLTLPTTTQTFPAETVVREAETVTLPGTTTVVTAPATGTVVTVTEPGQSVPQYILITRSVRVGGPKGHVTKTGHLLITRGRVVLYGRRVVHPRGKKPTVRSIVVVITRHR